MYLAVGVGLASLALYTRVWANIANGVTSGTTLITTIMWLPGPMRLSVHDVLGELLLIAWAVTNVAPLVAAATAAILTTQDMLSEQPASQRPLVLPWRTVVSGYVLAALHRLRILLALVIGLMPALVIGGAYFVLDFLTRLNAGCLDGCWWPLFFPTPDMERIGELLVVTFVAMAIGKWGANFLGAALGASLALRWRKALPAALVSVLVMLTLAMIRALLPYRSTLGLLEVSTEVSTSYIRGATWIILYTMSPLLAGSIVMYLAKPGLNATTG